MTPRDPIDPVAAVRPQTSAPLLRFREALRIRSEYAGEYVCGFADGGYVYVRRPAGDVAHFDIAALLRTAGEWRREAMCDHDGATVADWVLDLARQAQGETGAHPLTEKTCRVQLAHTEATARRWVRLYETRPVERAMAALLLCLKALVEERLASLDARAAGAEHRFPAPGDPAFSPSPIFDPRLVAHPRGDDSASDIGEADAARIRKGIG